ncbi:MAG: 4Fe-4S dicluster domain-containing protein [Chloroflexota bacterium]|nr:4Fe-4S dicluster domain-containing protein [Chloroflexota bacterium]
MSRKMLAVDWEKCTGCRLCEVACSLEHEGFCGPGYARLRVIKDEEQGIDFPLVCQHCTDAPCRSVCPTGALYWDAQGDVVLWNADRCIGCGLCFVACPVGTIFFDPQGEKIRKCDMCSGTPQCVKYCEPQAIQLVSRDEAYLPMGQRMLKILTGASLKKRLVPKKVGTGELKV